MVRFRQRGRQLLAVSLSGCERSGRRAAVDDPRLGWDRCDRTLRFQWLLNRQLREFVAGWTEGTGAMDKIATFAAVFSGIFIAVFVITFLWGVGKRILRWTVIIAAAYTGVIISLGVAHLSNDGAPLTMEHLLSAALGSGCSLAASIASRSSSCTGPAR